MQIVDWGSPNVEAGAARGHYREPKLTNRERGITAFLAGPLACSLGLAGLICSRA
jgi:hypothetical protein